MWLDLDAHGLVLLFVTVVSRLATSASVEGSVLCFDVICKSKRVCEPYIDCPKDWLYTILSISFTSAVLNKFGYTVNSLKADSPVRRRRTASGWSRPGRPALCATLGLACSKARFSIVSLHSLVFFCPVPYKGENYGHLATRTSRHYQVTTLGFYCPVCYVGNTFQVVCLFSVCSLFHV